MVAIASYDTNGSLDTTFGSGGVALLNNSSDFQGIPPIGLLSSGEYLIVTEFDAPLSAPVTAQVSSKGVLDSMVTGGTLVNTTVTNFSLLNSNTLFQPNGDYLIIQAAGNPNQASTVSGLR
jgi:hypothetical protein